PARHRVVTAGGVDRGADHDRHHRRQPAPRTAGPRMTELAQAPARNVTGGWRNLFASHSAALALRTLLIIAMGAALAVATDAFLQPANLLNVLRQASLMFLLASGLTLVILAGGFDLSVAANLTFPACLAAWL